MGICCFTGHRDIAADLIPALRDRLDECLYTLIDEGITVFRAGGARGFDTVAAEQVLGMRQRFDFIRLDLILPCHGQTKGWSAAEQVAYRRIMAEADRVIFLAEHYTPGCMQRRNLQLLAGADVCVAYQTHPGGGTGFTVSHARAADIRILNLARPQFPESP